MNDDNVWGSEVETLPEPILSSSTLRDGSAHHTVSGADVEADDVWGAPGAASAGTHLLERSSDGRDPSSEALYPQLLYAEQGLVHGDVASEPLPFGIDALEVRNAITSWTTQQLPTEESASLDAKELTTEVDVSPLSIDSTQDVWRRLTSIGSRIPRFSGSSIERETISILTEWNLKVKNQPSWDRGGHNKQRRKNRESIGTHLFGWNRTDLPEYKEPPSLITREQQSSHEEFNVLPNLSLPTVMEDADDFGDFESAPVSVTRAEGGRDMQVGGDQYVTQGLLSIATDPEPSALAIGLSLLDLHSTSIPVHGNANDLFAEPAQSGVLGTTVPDPGPSSTQAAVGSSGIGQGLMSMQDLLEDPSTLLASLSPTLPKAASTTKHVSPQLPSTVPSTSRASQDWDFALFEKQFAQSAPLTSDYTAQVTRKSSDTRTMKEKRDQETVERIVSLLPNIEHLLP